MSDENCGKNTPSFTNKRVVHNCCLLFLPATVCDSCGARSPLFGRTQYCLGAVVFTLKHTRSFVGLVIFRWDVTTSVNGPVIP